VLISVWLPTATVDRLTRLAHTHGLSVSAMLRNKIVHRLRATERGGTRDDDE